MKAAEVEVYAVTHEHREPRKLPDEDVERHLNAIAERD